VDQGQLPAWIAPFESGVWRSFARHGRTHVRIEAADAQLPLRAGSWPVRQSATLAQISLAGCSTQPGRGVPSATGALARATMAPVASTSTAFVALVP
jgi:hypothetical protein